MKPGINKLDAKPGTKPQVTAYGYVEAEARLANNTTVYRKSNNFSMDRYDMSIGLIILEVPTQVTAVASPAVIAKPVPGFLITFTLAGLFSSAYIITRKDD